MATPHHVPVNVKLTGNRALTLPQSLGSTYQQPETPRDHMADPGEAMLLSIRALERMVAAGWQGYTRKRKPVPARVFADVDLAREWRELPASVRDQLRNIVYQEIAEARPR